jgi:hypothetical protein
LYDNKEVDAGAGIAGARPPMGTASG